ncbi:hypothetical protein Tco_0802694 [Tanacetum coccineum]|uniref:Uncharacterized protein n=1 Tax=Tanacetum coccineum TaxID=301880 RepID=A0ABQ5A216_9ASTR
MFWHYARNDFMFTTIRVISKHQDTQVYDDILPQHLTNQAMLESEAYMSYHAYATSEKTLKPKSTKKKADSESSPKMKPTQASKGKRIKTSAKGDKPTKKKQSATKSKGLTVLSEKPSDEEDDNEVRLNDDDDDNDDEDNDDDDDDADNQDDDEQDDGQDDEDKDDVNEQTDSDNDGDDFVHPKLSNQDQEIIHNEEESDEEIQGTNVEEEELDEEETNDEDEANELYRDVNVNLEGRDIEMTDAQQTNVQTTQVIEDTHVLTLYLIVIMSQLHCDVPVTTIAEPPLLSTTTLPPLPTLLITHLQQTPVPTPATVPSSFLQDLPNFGSLFRVDHRLKTLENNFSEFNQTNHFTAALQSERFRDEAQAENADFINKLDDNIKKIIKDQVNEQVKAQVSKILPKIEKTVNEQLKVEVLTRSSNESKTSHVVAANLSELEPKKILIDKMDSNKSIHRYDAQKNLYKALVNAYESDKLILDTYGETVSFKRCRDEEDKDEEPFARSNQGSKRRRAGKEPESTSAPKEKTSKTTGKSTEGSKSHHNFADESAQAEEPMQTAKDLEESIHQEFKIGVTKDQPDEETSQLPDWFQKPTKPPTLDHDWNKTLPDAHGHVQHWLSSLTQMEDPRESFNELMDTPLHFSAFVMNRLKVDTLTLELLARPTFELMKGSCKSLQYPHDLRKPLPLISNSRGHRVIPFDHFINTDLVYLSGGVSSCTYTTLVTKTKAADYGNIKWIKDLVPNIMWIQVPVSYDKHALWESHIGDENDNNFMDLLLTRNLLEMSTPNEESLEDDNLYTFKEGDFNRLRIQDIEDMLLLLVQGKLTNLTVVERLDFNVSLRLFTRSVVIQRRVKDLQLGVESYQKKLNLTKLDTYRSDLKQIEAYSAYSNPRGFIYQNKDKKNRLMRIDELHKFHDGTLNDVRTALDDHLKGIQMKYLPQTIWRQSNTNKAGAMIQAIDKQLKTRRIMRNLEKFVGGRPYKEDFRLLQRTI